MERSRLYATVSYLVLGMWLVSSSFNEAMALSPSLTFLKLSKNQPGNNTPEPDTNSLENAITGFISPQPITSACPFPSIPLSSAATKAIFGISISFPAKEEKFHPGLVSEARAQEFVRGDGSDSDLNWTVDDLVKAKKLDQALQVAQKIKDVSQKNRAVGRVADAYNETGQLRQAFEAAKNITERLDQDGISVRDNVLSRIAKADIKAGQLEQALQVVESMGEGFKFYTLLDIADQYIKVNQPERAAQVIDQAVAAYRREKPISTDPEGNTFWKMTALNRIISRYVAVGRKEQAAELSSEIFEAAKTLSAHNYMTLSLLSGTAEVYALAGQKDKAAEILSYSLQAAKDIKETTIRSLLFATIAEEYVLLKQPERTTELLAQAIELAKSEKEVSKKSAVLIIIAHSYGVLGQYDKAFQVIDAVEPTLLQGKVKQALSCSQKSTK